MFGPDWTYWLVVIGTIVAAVIASAYVLAMMLRQQQAFADVKAKADRMREQLELETPTPTPTQTQTPKKNDRASERKAA